MSPIMRSIDSVLNLLLEFWNFYILKENWKNLKIMIMLLTGCIVGVICVIPYSLTIQKPILEKVELPLPLTVLIPLQIVQNAFIFLFLILVGLFAAHKAGLCVPAIDAWLTKKAFSLRKIFAISIPLGILAALLIIILDVFLFSPRMPPPAFGFERPPAWQGFLASFYGGIAEEVQLRLFLISLFVWGASKIRKGSWGVWVSIIMTSLLFGAGHLPTAAMVWKLTGFVILRTLALNGLAGLVFGWLYWKKGLEAAMIAHFSSDIVLHVIAPLISG